MKIIFCCFLAFLLFGCWPSKIGFRDTGGMPEEWEKFHVQTLQINAPTCPLSYAANLSEAIKDGIQNNTRLTIAPDLKNAQVQLSGEITRYAVSPIALQNGDNAAKNRLTITLIISLNYTTPKQEDTKLTITRFADYEASANFTSIENQLLNTINEQIIQDIINKLMSNW
ncbi:MAG TPA: hypothetical protein DEF82_04835 [Crocinitomicaceae bacterium]|nr:hypothetical protein [Crocinitomicaceae bacterium]